MIVDIYQANLNSSRNQHSNTRKSIYEGDSNNSWLEDIANQKPDAIDSYYLEQQKLSREFSGKEFYISELPNIWPLNTFKMAYAYLPQALKKSLENTKIGYVNSTQEMNAYALSNLNKIGMINGLSTNILEVLYCTIPDKREYLSKSFHYPPQLFHYANQIKEAAKGIVFEKSSGQDRDKLYDAFYSFYEWKQKLSDDFPDYRQIIESFAAGPGNSLTIFTFLHELGHVFLEHDSYSDDIQKNFSYEYEADEYALHVYFQMLDKQEEFQTISHIAFAPLLMSIFEFYDRLNGLTFEDTMQNKSLTHPRNIDRRARLFNVMGTFFRDKGSLRDNLIKEIDFAYSIHIFMSSMLSNKGLDPLAPFFTKGDVNAFNFNMPPYHAFQAATESVKGVEYIPYS